MSPCQFAAKVFGVNLDDFANWNDGTRYLSRRQCRTLLTDTGLGDIRSKTCAFTKGARYCGRYYSGAGSAKDIAAMTKAMPTNINGVEISRPHGYGQSVSIATSSPLSLAATGTGGSSLAIRIRIVGLVTMMP